MNSSFGRTRGKDFLPKKPIPTPFVWADLTSSPQPSRLKKGRVRAILVPSGLVLPHNGAHEEDFLFIILLVGNPNLGPDPGTPQFQHIGPSGRRASFGIPWERDLRSGRWALAGHQPFGPF